MNNIIEFNGWRRTSGQVRGPTATVQDCAMHKNVERARFAKLPAFQVTAVFAGGEVTFWLSINNTFGDLAERLDHLGERYSGMPVAVYFKPYMAGQPISDMHKGA